MATTLDYMEYSTDALARTAYVTNSATDDSYTTCLLHFENNVTDSSASGLTFSKGAGITFTTAYTPFFGYSALYDGSAACTLYCTAGTATNLSGGVWTIDCKIYTNLDAIRSIFTIITNATNYIYGYVQTSGKLAVDLNVGGSLTRFETASACISANTPYHVAFVENGNDWYMFVDGTQVYHGTSALRPANYTGFFTIGQAWDSANWVQPFVGYIDEFRISKGVARWTSAFTPPTAPYAALQAYSESTIKAQGSYSLKGIANTSSINKTLTRTISSPLDLSGLDQFRFDIYSSRTGSNIKIGIHDSGGTTTETTPNITSANTWQTVVWDISAVSTANKDAIDSIIITIVNADSANTFYIDNFISAENVSVTAEPFIITTSLSSLGGIIVDGLGYVYEESTSGVKIDVSLRTGSTVMKTILRRKNLKYIYHRINTHGKDVTMTVYVDGVAQTPTFTINTSTLTTRRIEDIPDTWEGKRFDIELSCNDVTDDGLEIHAPLVMRFTSVGS